MHVSTAARLLDVVTSAPNPSRWVMFEGKLGENQWGLHSIAWLQLRHSVEQQLGNTSLLLSWMHFRTCPRTNRAQKTQSDTLTCR